MEALFSPSVQLPALAQLMKLRRAGVDTWRCTKDGATHELLLRPLPTRWRAARRTLPQHRASHDEGAAAVRSPRKSRGARRRSNIAEKKRRAAMCLQRFARGMLGRVAGRSKDLIEKEALATKAAPKKKRKTKTALLQPGMRTTTRTLATLTLMRRARGKQQPRLIASAVPAAAEPNDPPPRSALKRRSIVRPSAWRAEERGEQAATAGT